MPIPILSAISAALSATNALKAIASTVVDAKMTIDVAEWRLRTAEVVSALADAKLEVVETLAQIAELERQLDQRGNIHYQGGLYWETRDDGEHGPYCSRCWDVNERLVHVHPVQLGRFACPECESAVDGAETAAILEERWRRFRDSPRGRHLFGG